MAGLGRYFPDFVVDFLPVLQAALAAAGADSWLAQGNPGIGDTCCHDPALTDPAGAFDERIDHVLVRRAVGAKGPLAPVHADVIGDDEDERGPNGLWSSDHAGVWVRLGWNQLFK